jgi:F0F1-type ATP synthase assembly protein I
MTHRNNGDDSWLRNLGLFGVIVSDLVGFTGAGFGLGYFAMKQWNAPWWVLFLTTIAGLGLAMLQIYRLTQDRDSAE